MSSYIEVEMVGDKSSFRHFINLPWKIYKNDPHWVPPLKRDIKDIYNASWEKNWGFVPMTDEEMDYMARKLKMIAEQELIRCFFMSQ